MNSRTHRRDNCGKTVTVVTLDTTLFSEESFSRVLTYLYTGLVELTKESQHLDETIAVANLLNLPELALVCENARKGEEFLNPSIGTWLNDRNSDVAKELFFNKVGCRLLVSGDSNVIYSTR